MGQHGRPMRAGAAVAAVAALLAAACGDDDDSSSADDDGSVEVVAVDYRFEDLPGSVPQGTRLTLRNESTIELHELVVLRLPDGEERSVDQLLALPEEELEFLADSEPTMVLIAPPGGPGQAVVGDGSVLEPGRYAVICAIPLGADPAAYIEAAQTSDGPPDVAGGPPHFAEGMYAELVVE